MSLQFIIKTIIAQRDNVYSSFPTMVEHAGDVYIYYRQGHKDSYQCHGLNGRVRCLRVNKAALLKHFAEANDSPVLLAGDDLCVFDGDQECPGAKKNQERPLRQCGSHPAAVKNQERSLRPCGSHPGAANNNELDAIVSGLQGDLFTLCSRVYVRDRSAATYISFANTPVFDGRREVVVEGVAWLVFYGKAFRWGTGYVFPAYGVLEGRDQKTMPLVLYTGDLVSWTLLSYVQGDGIILNENSIVYYDGRYVMFIRQDSAPYGIWYAVSGDLRSWSA
ncbi:MAG: exo-alpha-sialidase, partial [Nitrospirae bacterium]|nr:exo-alpha-sialidase [Nitrospirota bacterium]